MCSFDDYQEYAAECLDWARSAKSEKEQTIFLQMTQAWLHAALQHLKSDLQRSSPTMAGRRMTG